MATIPKLLECRALFRVTVPLLRRQFHDRLLYVFPDTLAWMRNDVPQMVTGAIQADSSPRDQLVLRLRQWMAGEVMRYPPMFHDMRPKDQHVWEMKTPDLRLFGWIYQPNVFIVARHGYADDYKGNPPAKRYDDEVRAVVLARNNLDLDEPKHAVGDFDDLVRA